MLVSEIFRSLQGECLLQGAPTTFIRFAGCPLACSYCDTRYAHGHENSIELSPSAVIDRVRQFDRKPRHICLTGGEPLIQPKSELIALFKLLLDLYPNRLTPTGQMYLSIETGGSQAVDWLTHGSLRKDINLVIDYKLGSSGMSRNMAIKNYHHLGVNDVLKFVCGNIDDALEATSVLQTLSYVHTCNPIVYFHALGGEANVWLADFLLDKFPQDHWHRFNIRMGIQLHKLLWGNKRSK